MRHLRYLLPLLLAFGLIGLSTTVGSAAPKDTPSTATCKPDKTHGSKVCPTPPPPVPTYTVINNIHPELSVGGSTQQYVYCQPNDTVVRDSAKLIVRTIPDPGTPNTSVITSSTFDLVNNPDGTYQEGLLVSYRNDGPTNASYTVQITCQDNTP